jgi:hypothetical protein
MSEEIEFDVRTVRHQLRRQKITNEQVEKYLASLPDDAEHAEETETRFVGHFEQRRAEGEVDGE